MKKLLPIAYALVLTYATAPSFAHAGAQPSAEELAFRKQVSELSHKPKAELLELYIKAKLNADLSCATSAIVIPAVGTVFGAVGVTTAWFKWAAGEVTKIFNYEAGQRISKEGHQMGLDAFAMIGMGWDFYATLFTGKTYVTETQKCRDDFRNAIAIAVAIQQHSQEQPAEVASHPSIQQADKKLFPQDATRVSLRSLSGVPAHLVK